MPPSPPALLLTLLACVGLVAACDERTGIGGGRDGDVQLDQDVTRRPPQDPIFSDFEHNWRKFVTQAPLFTLPVVRPDVPPEQQEPWEPLVIAECVFSPDVGAQVPRVTLTWNEPVSRGGDDIDVVPPGDDVPPGGATPPGTTVPPTTGVDLAAVRSSAAASAVGDAAPTVSAAGGAQAPPPADSAVPGKPDTGGRPGAGGKPDVGGGSERIDLALHHDGFGRNYYSSALSSELTERFRLPANSALIADNEAVMLTGPALFPRLTDFRTDLLSSRDTGEEFRRRTLVLSDLSEGLTYTIRLSGRADDRWAEERQFSFLTPICHEDF